MPLLLCACVCIYALTPESECIEGGEGRGVEGGEGKESSERGKGENFCNLVILLAILEVLDRFLSILVGSLSQTLSLNIYMMRYARVFGTRVCFKAY